MTSEEELTAHAAKWAKQFRDDNEVLKEFDEGDEFQDKLRKVLSTRLECDPSTMLFQSHPNTKNGPRTRRGG